MTDLTASKSAKTITVLIDTVNSHEIGLSIAEKDKKLEITSIRSGSIGSKKFLVGDTIVGVNGKRVTSKQTLKKTLDASTSSKSSKAKLEFTVQRKDSIQNYDKEHNDLNTVMNMEFSTIIIDNPTHKPNGLVVSHTEDPGNLMDLTVKHVDDTSPFAGKLMPEDWILAVNGEKVTDEAAFKRIFSQQTIAVSIGRRKPQLPKHKKTVEGIPLDEEAKLIQEEFNDLSFIDPPTEIREVMSPDEQKKIIKWRTENLNDHHKHNAMNTLEAAMKELEKKLGSNSGVHQKPH